MVKHTELQSERTANNFEETTFTARISTDIDKTKHNYDYSCDLVLKQMLF